MAELLGMRVAPTTIGAQHCLSVAVRDQLGDSKCEREHAGWKATHRNHQREPTRVRVRPLMSNAPENCGRQQSGYGSAAEDDDASA